MAFLLKILMISIFNLLSLCLVVFVLVTTRKVSKYSYKSLVHLIMHTSKLKEYNANPPYVDIKKHLGKQMLTLMIVAALVLAGMLAILDLVFFGLIETQDVFNGLIVALLGTTSAILNTLLLILLLFRIDIRLSKLDERGES